MVELKSTIKTIAVTGGSGFVGSAVISELSHQKIKGIALSRKKLTLPSNFSYVKIPEIGTQTSYGNSLSGVDCIIHCAARVHVLNEHISNPISEFREVNTFGVLNFAKQAIAAGVKRFIFISSIKVNGEKTDNGKYFFANDSPHPTDPYGISKLEAEHGLIELSKKTGLEVTIIRPTLVYGPGVKANFESMMKWLSCGVPMPLGAIRNKRSLVYIENLTSLILICIEHKKANREVFLVSDDNDISTPQLLSLLAKTLGVPNRIVSVPIRVLEIAALIIGRKDLVIKLCSSLRVDITKTKELLDWEPPISIGRGLRETAKFYMTNKESYNK